MSYSNGRHLSASQRQLQAMGQRLAQLETMAMEYNLLLNHLIKRSPLLGRYCVFKDDLKADGPPRIVRSEIKTDPDGRVFIEYTLCEPETPPSIIVPASS